MGVINMKITWIVVERAVELRISDVGTSVGRLQGSGRPQIDSCHCQRKCSADDRVHGVTLNP